MTDELPDQREALAYDPSTIGTTGLRAFGGYVQEEFLKELRGLNGSRIYREMADNDPTVGALLFAVEMLIRRVPWTVQAADDTDEADTGKQFVEECMQDMSVSWTSVISEVCSMFKYGFAPMEIIWKKREGPDATSSEGRSQFDDGMIGIRTITLRAQNTIPKWEIDREDGSIDGVWQMPYDRPMVMIPIEKLLLFRTTEERGNPEGRSLLRNAYRPWYFKKKLEEIEAIGLERDLAGLPVAYIPSNYLAQGADVVEKAVANEYKRLIRSIKRDTQEGLVLPSTRDTAGNLMFEIKLLSTGGSRQFDTTKVIDRYAKAIATTVLADFILLGQGSVGSHALSSNKTDMFATAVGAFTASIADVFTRHLLPRLWKLNALDPETMPTIVAGDLERPDLTALGGFMSALTGAGAQMFPDRELENYLREAAGLPLAPEDSGLEGAAPNDAPDAPGAADPNKPDPNAPDPKAPDPKAPDAKAAAAKDAPPKDEPPDPKAAAAKEKAK